MLLVYVRNARRTGHEAFGGRRINNCLSCFGKGKSIAVPDLKLENTGACRIKKVNVKSTILQTTLQVMFGTMIRKVNLGGNAIGQVF